MRRLAIAAEVEPLTQVKMICAMHEGHRLAKQERITPRDLEGENMIGSIPVAAQHYGLEQDTLNQAGTRVRHVIKTHTSHTRYAMVANRLGLSIVEPFAAKIWSRHGVVVRPFSGDISYDYVLAYPGGSIRSGLMHDFRDAALTVAKNYWGLLSPPSRSTQTCRCRVRRRTRRFARGCSAAASSRCFARGS